MFAVVVFAVMVFASGCSASTGSPGPATSLRPATSAGPTTAITGPPDADSGGEGAAGAGAAGARATGAGATGADPSDNSSANSSARLRSTVDPDQDRRDAVADLVAQRARALTRRDGQAWLATLSDPTGPFARRQGVVFEQMLALPIVDYGQRGVEIAPALTAARAEAVGPDAWLSTVHQSYRLDGYDRAPHTYDASYTVVRTPAGWRFADDTDGASQAQPWDLPAMTVLRSPTTLVVGNAPTAQLRADLEMGEAAHARVAAVWGSALPGVLVVPATVDELTAQLQRSSTAGLDQVAGVTNGPLTTGTPATADRVYLNPQALARLTPDGRRVVITHELTHVTVRGTTTQPVPVWLSEGFADYVGFQGVALPPRTVAADLLAKVRSGTGPTRLPVPADFDPTQGVIAPTYSAAWLAVTRMAQVHGSARVVAFYRTVAGGSVADPGVVAGPTSAAQAFQNLLGTSEEAFVADWLAYLGQLAR